MTYDIIFFCHLSILFILSSHTCDSLHPVIPRRKPVFTVDPQNAFGLLKRSLSLRCHADGEPPPLIIWYKDGHLVQSVRERPGTSNKIIKSDELMFISFEKDDEGNYCCNASNSEGWTISKTANVSLAYLDPISEGPQHQVTGAGEDVILHCKIPRGVPPPTINWYFHSELIKNSPHVKIIDGDLYISNVQRRDTGTYQCEVCNLAGCQRSQLATLTVYQKPQFEVRPSNQQVKVGEDVEFMCHVNGDPKPSILWRRENGFHIPEDRSVLRDDKSFRIFQVRREDAGIYVCQAKNEAGSVETSAKLTVLSPPSFTITPTDTIVAEGEKAVFYCQAGGNPTPYLRWMRSGEYFLYPDFRSSHTVGKPRVFVDHEGSLVVTSARKSDEGTYECRASHKTGMVRSSANLFVSDSNFPSIVIIDLGPQNQTAVVGTTATLLCEARLLGSIGHSDTIQQDTHGSVRVTWLKDGFTLPTDSDTRIVLLTQGTLQINDINFSDQGNYTCRAEITPTGFQQHLFYPAEWTASLRVSLAPHPNFQTSVIENLPRPPASVDVVAVGDSWISLKSKFSALPVAPIFINPQNEQSINDFGILIPSAQVVERTRVRIEYIGIDGNHGWIVAAEARPDETVKISGLIPESGYRIVVRMVSPRGVGTPYIIPHTVYTKKRNRYVNFTSYPTDHLSEVYFSTPQLSTLSTSEIKLYSSVCGAPNVISLLTGIRVRYRQVPLAHCLVRDGASSRDSPDRCANFLLPSFNNEISLPKDSFELLSENYCSLQMPPEKLVEYARPGLGGYQGQSLSQTENYRFMELDLLESAPFQMVLDNLTPFVCYEVEVGAYSEDRTMGRVYSQGSRVSRILTFDSTPSQAPQNIRARWLGTLDKVLEVVWVPPPTWSTNGLLTGFSLRLLGRKSEQSHTFQVDPMSTAYRVDNLQPEVNYTLYMAAVTCHGEGVRSEPHPIIASHFLQLMGRNASDFFFFGRHPIADSGSGTSDTTISSFNIISPSTTNGPIGLSGVPQVSSEGIHHYTWIILCLIGISLIWLLIFVGVLVCRRRQRLQRIKQRYPPNETTTTGRQLFQQPMLTPVGLSKHGSPRLQMGTGGLNSPRTMLSQGEETEVGYEALDGQPESLKITSAGGIFLATGRTTSSSSQDSSIHKGVNETRVLADGSAESNRVDHVDEEDDTATVEDHNTVSPYASASLIKQLHPGRCAFPNVIPPPPSYPPPSVPSDSPPVTSGVGGTTGSYEAYVPGECHYALSDLQICEEPVFVGTYGASPMTGFVPIAPGYPHEQYWGSAASPGVCYMQQSSRNGTLCVSHLMSSGFAPPQTTQSVGAFMTPEQRDHQSYHPSPVTDHHSRMLIQQQQVSHPSSALADNVVLPTSTLVPPNRNQPLHHHHHHQLPPLQPMIRADNNN